MPLKIFFLPALLLALVAAGAMAADNATPDQPCTAAWAVHGQWTTLAQQHAGFTSPYSGANSLDAQRRSAETTDLTLSAGRRLWRGAELWFSPEIDQGFGLSNTVGIAGFPSGEAYKIGANAPYLRLPRLFLRQVVELGGATEQVDAAPTQLAGQRRSDKLTLSVGKLSVVDIFDSNSYAHDARFDFMNWSVIDAGAFDYAADPWGFTYGAAAEWTQHGWTLRAGVFQLSSAPNGKISRLDFSQYSMVAELEARHQWLGHAGKIKLLGFANHARMGRYSDAVQQAQVLDMAPDTSQVRHRGSRAGLAINLEQELAPDFGVFARASANDGSQEAYEFTEINQSLAFGTTLKGERWGRPSDAFGAALVVNALSGAAQRYFADGGIGILIGDGRLNYGTERIIETYYSLHLQPRLTLAFDYQHVANPAYNRDRGPVAIYGVRLHSEF